MDGCVRACVELRLDEETVFAAGGWQRAESGLQVKLA